MRTALIVHGGWEGHEPDECAAIYRRWLHEDGFSVRMVSDTSALAEPDIHDLSLIIPVMGLSRLEKAEEDNLARAIEAGVGMAGHHGGMEDEFDGSSIYHRLVGGRAVDDAGDVVDLRVDNAAPDDAIMAGIKSFDYRAGPSLLHDDPANEVLATASLAAEDGTGAAIPVVWKRRHGAGRVFCSALGQSVEAFDHPEVATIMRRGLNWAARDTRAQVPQS